MKREPIIEGIKSGIDLQLRSATLSSDDAIEIGRAVEKHLNQAIGLCLARSEFIENQEALNARFRQQLETAAKQFDLIVFQAQEMAQVIRTEAKKNHEG